LLVNSAHSKNQAQFICSSPVAVLLRYAIAILSFIPYQSLNFWKSCAA
jgi:hypothetical protein